MTNTGLAANRLTADTNASAPTAAAELSWPPSSDDLNAIEVIALHGHSGGLRDLDLEAFRAEELPVVRRRGVRARHLLAAAACLVVVVEGGRAFWPRLALDDSSSLPLPAMSGTPDSVFVPPVAVRRRRCDGLRTRQRRAYQRGGGADDDRDRRASGQHRVHAFHQSAP